MPRTVVIIGASRGIGREMCRLYAERGDRVIAGVRALPAVIGASAMSSLIQYRVVDVGSPLSVGAFQDALAGTPVDILINSAGVLGGDRQNLDDMDYEAWRHAFDINTIAPFLVTTALLDNLRAADEAKVITLTSQMGSLNQRSTGSYAYRSSKAAANKVMQVMALELEAEGIVVCPVHPGWVKTDMGGPQADITVEESASGLVTLIDRLTLAQTGRFWTWEGVEHPW